MYFLIYGSTCLKWFLFSIIFLFFLLLQHICFYFQDVSAFMTLSKIYIIKKLGREPPGCKKHVFLSKPPCCEQLHGSSIGDFANVSKKITSIYLTFLSTPELIMMCRVFHLSTFRPPVDNAISCAHCRRRVFLSTVINVT